MSRAVHGRVHVAAHPYPEFADLTPLPGRTQDEFRAWFEELIGRRSAPLSPGEYQLAYAVAREAWRACWWSCAHARGVEERQPMGEDTETLGTVRIEVERGQPGQQLVLVEAGG